MWSIYLPLLCARRFSHIPSFIPHHTTLEVRTNRPLYKRKLGVREGLDTAETLACGELSSDVIRPFIGYCFVQRRHPESRLGCWLYKEQSGAIAGEPLGAGHPPFLQLSMNSSLPLLSGDTF